MRLPTVAAAALALASCAALPGDDDDRYLHPRAFDARDHLPPPPKEGTAAERRDREIFHATRPLKDTPRWSLAQADADKSRILDGYACALGASITPQTNPKLAAMMERMRGDVRAAVAGPHDHRIGKAGLERTHIRLLTLCPWIGGNWRGPSSGTAPTYAEH